MLQISKWYNNYQAPVVLMIDDLSDAYIEVYDEKYKNDWGYFCDSKNSSYDFLYNNLLKNFPMVKITFFTPYLRHNVINENSKYRYEKYAVGERKEFTTYLQTLTEHGHEIAHHGSNHGKYIDNKITSTANNWIHEWALFDDIKSGVEVTMKGVEIFKDKCNINIVGGKYCGYVQRENSQDIINECNFLYWCDKPSYNVKSYDETFFGSNNIISFPTTFAGNAFVRLTYLSGDKLRDKKKNFSKYFQKIYNVYAYYKLYKLYKKRQIISIQEHNSPSTSAGFVQSANIITDINSLKKIFNFFKPLSIWYATCENISTYIYVRENSQIKIEGDSVIIIFNNIKKIQNPTITLESSQKFKFVDQNNFYMSNYNNGKYILNLNIQHGDNIYKLVFLDN